MLVSQLDAGLVKVLPKGPSVCCCSWGCGGVGERVVDGGGGCTAAGWISDTAGTAGVTAAGFSSSGWISGAAGASACSAECAVDIRDK